MGQKLTKELVRKRQELTERLINDSITKEDAQELRDILIIERERATEIEDSIAFVVILLLLNKVNDFLSPPSITIKGITSNIFPKGLDLRKFRENNMDIKIIKKPI